MGALCARLVSSRSRTPTSPRSTASWPGLRRCGWIKGRNDCWKSDAKSACVRTEYQRRIAELQARYRLVPATGPFRFECVDNAASEVTVTFFPTAPATSIAESAVSAG